MSIYMNTDQLRTLEALAIMAINARNQQRFVVSSTFHDYPWGETNNRHIYVTFFYNNQPGHNYAEIDEHGDVVHEWTGGLD